jgi:hypothetical protein
MGAVPFQEAKCALDGKRVMSPTSTSSRAAPDGPIPMQLRQCGTGFGETRHSPQDARPVDLPRRTVHNCRWADGARRARGLCRSGRSPTPARWWRQRVGRTRSGVARGESSPRRRNRCRRRRRRRRGWRAGRCVHGPCQHGMPEEVGSESAAGHRCSSDGGAQWMVLVATDRPATRATVTRCQITRTFSACGPFWPATVSNSTRWLSSRLL